MLLLPPIALQACCFTVRKLLNEAAACAINNKHPQWERGEQSLGPQTSPLSPYPAGHRGSPKQFTHPGTLFAAWAHSSAIPICF